MLFFSVELFLSRKLIILRIKLFPNPTLFRHTKNSNGSIRNIRTSPLPSTHTALTPTHHHPSSFLHRPTPPSTTGTAGHDNSGPPATRASKATGRALGAAEGVETGPLETARQKGPVPRGSYRVREALGWEEKSVTRRVGRGGASQGGRLALWFGTTSSCVA